MKENSSTSILIKPLKKCTRAEAGTKGHNLNLLSRIKGVSIPETLCIPATYFDEIKKLNISEKKQTLSTFKLPADFTSVLIDQIFVAFGQNKLVVRSSATCEDTPFLSFAGNYSSFLNISGKKQVLRAIKLCYLSMFNENAKVYAKQGKVNLSKHRMAILIQPVAPVIQTGVMFTTNPMNHNKKEVVIEFVNGLGDKMVEGSVRPTTIVYPVPLRRGAPDTQFKHLAKMGKIIESKFKRPQDTEWGILKDGSIFFFQSRPITTTKTQMKKRAKIQASSFLHGELLAKGTGASPGAASGWLLCVLKKSDLKKITRDTVLSFENNVDLHFLQHLSKVRGIIINGGALSHVAVIARELRIPLIASVSKKIVKFNGTRVIIDGEGGLISKIL